MAGPTRNAVFNALLALGAGLQIGGSTFFVTATRRPRPPSAFTGGQPALMQSEYVDAVAQRTGMPQRRVWKPAWLILMNFPDENSVPAETVSDVIDALDALFPPNAPAPGVAGLQNLGGLVHSVKIMGEIEVHGGTADSQVLVVVPLEIIVP